MVFPKQNSANEVVMIVKVVVVTIVDWIVVGIVEICGLLLKCRERLVLLLEKWYLLDTGTSLKQIDKTIRHHNDSSLPFTTTK